MAGRKIFVGSLPNGINEPTLRDTFQQYGHIEDVYIKQGCEPGRQWAFVTFATPEQAQQAKDLCDRTLTFPGSERPCDVMVARNQGMYGQSGDGAPNSGGGQADGPKKIFVGSLPDDITAEVLQMEFSKYGVVVDTYIKEGCQPGRQWAFVTFNTSQEAQLAKVSCDRILTLPGSARACEVTLARNQGMYGQDSLNPHQGGNQGHHGAHQMAGPKKIFVGSLPDNITETVLRAEFSSYGHITDVYLKTGCEPGRQWAFVTFATPDQAYNAKEATDRRLMLPGGEKPCEVMLAKNQGMFGQDPMKGGGDPHQGGPHVVPPMYGGHGGGYGGKGGPGGGCGGGGAHQPPPPTAPPPPHLTPWRCYHTAAGLPYYHNHKTGATVWECPPELQAAGGAHGGHGGQYGGGGFGGGRQGGKGGHMGGRFSPY